MKRLILGLALAFAASPSAGFFGRSAPVDWETVKALYAEQKYTEALPALKSLAPSNPDAKRMLAFMLARGLGGEHDPDKGAALYRELADAGDPEAMWELASFYTEFGYLKNDPEKRLSLITGAAEKGLVKAQLELAEMYAYGSGEKDGPARDAEKGLSWYRRAAESGDAGAMGRLTDFYFNHGKPLDAKLAAYWAARYAEAARSENDIRVSARALGFFYRSGTGVRADDREAFKWSRIAAAHGDAGYAAKSLEELRRKLSFAQIEAAEKAAKDWKPGQKVVLLDPPPPKRAVSPPPPAPTRSALAAPLAPKFARPENSNAYALVVGIEEYKNAPEAAFASRDAEAMCAYLRAMGFPERNIVRLAGADASLSGLLSYLEEWLPNNIGPESRLFVYFSGHGAPDAKTGEPYLVPWDGKLAYLKTTALPLSRFYKDLNALGAKSVVVALDACFSGSGARSALQPGTRPLVVARVELAAPKAELAVLASSSSGEVSLTNQEAGHGLFTFHLLMALDAAFAAGGETDAGGVFDRLAPGVSDAARRGNGEQTPRFWGTRELPLR